MSWRQTCTGMSSPARLATRAAQPPATSTTTGAENDPRVVSTPVDGAAGHRDRGHLGALDQPRAALARRAEEAHGDRGRVRVPGSGLVGGHVPIVDRQRRARARRISPASTTPVSMPSPRCIATFARSRSARAPDSSHRKPVRTKPHSPPTRSAQSRNHGKDAQARLASAGRS